MLATKMRARNMTSGTVRTAGMEALPRRRRPALLAIDPLISGEAAPGAFSFMRRGRAVPAASAALSLEAVGAPRLPGGDLGIGFYQGMRKRLRSDAPVPPAGVIDRNFSPAMARCILPSGTTPAALKPVAIRGGPAVAGFAGPTIADVVTPTASSSLVSVPVPAPPRSPGEPRR